MRFNEFTGTKTPLRLLLDLDGLKNEDVQSLIGLNSAIASRYFGKEGSQIYGLSKVGDYSKQQTAAKNALGSIIGSYIQQKKMLAAEAMTPKDAETLLRNAMDANVTNPYAHIAFSAFLDAFAHPAVKQLAAEYQRLLKVNFKEIESCNSEIAALAQRIQAADPSDTAILPPLLQEQTQLETKRDALTQATLPLVEKLEDLVLKCVNPRTTKYNGDDVREKALKDLCKKAAELQQYAVGQSYIQYLEGEASFGFQQLALDYLNHLTPENLTPGYVDQYLTNIGADKVSAPSLAVPANKPQPQTPPNHEVVFEEDDKNNAPQQGDANSSILGAPLMTTIPSFNDAWSEFLLAKKTKDLKQAAAKLPIYADIALAEFLEKHSGIGTAINTTAITLKKALISALDPNVQATTPYETTKADLINLYYQHLAIYLANHADTPVSIGELAQQYLNELKNPALSLGRQNEIAAELKQLIVQYIPAEFLEKHAPANISRLADSYDKQADTIKAKIRQDRETLQHDLDPSTRATAVNNLRKFALKYNNAEHLQRVFMELKYLTTIGIELFPNAYGTKAILAQTTPFIEAARADLTALVEKFPVIAQLNERIDAEIDALQKAKAITAIEIEFLKDQVRAEVAKGKDITHNGQPASSTDVMTPIAVGNVVEPKAILKMLDAHKAQIEHACDASIMAIFSNHSLIYGNDATQRIKDPNGTDLSYISLTDGDPLSSPKEYMLGRIDVVQSNAGISFVNSGSHGPTWKRAYKIPAPLIRTFVLEGMVHPTNDPAGALINLNAASKKVAESLAQLEKIITSDFSLVVPVPSQPSLSKKVDALRRLITCEEETLLNADSASLGRFSKILNTWSTSRPVNKGELEKGLTDIIPFDENIQSRQALADFIEKILERYQSKMAALTSFQGMRVTQFLLRDNNDSDYQSALSRCKELLSVLRRLPTMPSDSAIKLELELANQSSSQNDIQDRYTVLRNQEEAKIRTSLEEVYENIVKVYAIIHHENRRRESLGHTLAKTFVGERTHLENALAKVLETLNHAANLTVRQAAENAKAKLGNTLEITVQVVDISNPTEPAGQDQKITEDLDTLWREDEAVYNGSKVQKVAESSGLTLRASK